MSGLSDLLLVGSGGFLGSIARYKVGGFILHRTPQLLFPLGTLVVNVLGCAIIGFLAGMAVRAEFPDYSWKLFLITGLLGGFTTFSAFGLESFLLLKQQEYIWAVINLLGSPLVGTLAVLLGYQTAATIFRSGLPLN